MIAFVQTWVLVEALFAALAAAWAAVPFGQWIPALLCAGFAGLWAYMLWELRRAPLMVFLCAADALVSLWFAWEVVQI